MAITAGFAEVDITPPLGTHKMGWKRIIVADEVLDPLFARIAIFRSLGNQLALIQLDTACIERVDAATIRRRIHEVHGFPEGAIMVAATHNHAGPAVGWDGDTKPDAVYVASMIAKITTAFGEALAKLAPVAIGFGSGFEFRVAHNRRIVMRDGTVRTHGKFSDPQALFIEGPVDPEVHVMAVCGLSGKLLATLVNYACHPTHQGGSTKLTAGFPGVLAQQLKRYGCPFTMFLNGAAGNVHTAQPTLGGQDRPMDECGRLLAETVFHVLTEMEYRVDVTLRHASAQVELPYRTLTEQEINGTVRGAQRFIDPQIYEREIASLRRRIEVHPTETAEVQAFWFNDHVYVSVPGELFVELGLEIKTRAFPQRVTVVGYANGSVGYLPHQAAFERGGYETTFCGSSRLAPGAGEMVVAVARELLAGRECTEAGMA